MVKLYRKHLSDPWFSLMAVGYKTVEGRLNQGDWSSIQECDQIDWFNDDFGLKREFRTPWVPFIPILGIIACLLMMVGLGWTNWLRLFAWMAIGVLIYFVYSKKNSKLNHPDK